MRPEDKDRLVAAMTPPAGVAPRAGSDENAKARDFQPGLVFARRYRMITLLGRGGMGEVWRADDLVLQTPVALKLIRSANQQARDRILKEVRLARQVTHPAVCRVFDVGEADGETFYSMEFVQAEDLTTLLRRVGRLPWEKVVDIAQQLCGALSAAHAQGVLHRDLKPANVLMDEWGRVRITDFGIAIAPEERDDASFMGTPGYMAPEQLLPGTPLSERTDLFALGVVLYELLVGQRPFQDSNVFNPPVRPSLLISDVDPRLEQIILRTLDPDPAERPASAAEVSAHLPTSSVAASRNIRWPWLLAAAALMVATTAAMFVPWSSPEGPGLTEHDTIVVADFMNTTGESVFDGALKVALAVALEQSPFLKVFPDERVRETLRLMERPPDERLTRSIAREIARRERLKAMVAGSIGSLGSHYVLALEAVNVETGDVMAREQIEVEATEDVLTSLGDVTARLRAKLGESLTSVQQFDAPLPRATTTSLEALHAYSLALEQGRANPRPEAIPHLTRAIELDPDFAMAQAFLSGVYANTGRSADAPAHSRRAFELRDRVSERERFFISWRYYVDAAQAWDKALELAQAWTRTYPREAFAFNSLGMASAAFGEHEQAVAAFRDAIRLDAEFVPPYGNLIGSLIASNRFDEAQTVLQEARSRGIDATSMRRAAYLLSFMTGDSTAAARELAAAGSMVAPMWIATWEARTAAFAGRFQAAHEQFQRAVQSAVREGLDELGAQWTVEDAESHAVAGQCEQASEEIGAALSLSRDNYTIERAARTLALCGRADRASTLANDLASALPDATLTHRVQLPVTTAIIALQGRQPQRALDVLEKVKAYDHAPSAEFWPPYLRGQAHLQLHNPAAAAAEFEAIAARRGEGPTSPVYALAYFGVARAATTMGQLDRARAAYERLFALWNGADADLAPLVEARREFARLR